MMLQRIALLLLQLRAAAAAAAVGAAFWLCGRRSFFFCWSLRASNLARNKINWQLRIHRFFKANARVCGWVRFVFRVCGRPGTFQTLTDARGVERALAV